MPAFHFNDSFLVFNLFILPDLFIFLDTSAHIIYSKNVLMGLGYFH